MTEIILISHSHFIPLVFAECIHRKAPASPFHNKEHKKKKSLWQLQPPRYSDNSYSTKSIFWGGNASTPPNSSRDPKSALNNLTQCLVFKLLVTLSSHSLRNSDVPCLITRGLQFWKWKWVTKNWVYFRKYSCRKRLLLLELVINNRGIN